VAGKEDHASLQHTTRQVRQAQSSPAHIGGNVRRHIFEKFVFKMFLVGFKK